MFALRRLYCPQCKLLHTELPDFMIPNKHYTKAVIDGVRNNSIDYCAADDRTISRWKK